MTEYTIKPLGTETWDALQNLDLIAQAGGGVVGAYPQDTAGRKISASFLYGATRGTFGKAGFDYERPEGKNHCVMRKNRPGRITAPRLLTGYCGQREPCGGTVAL